MKGECFFKTKYSKAIAIELQDRPDVVAKAACELSPGVYCLKKSLSTTSLIHWALAQYRFDHYKKTNEEPRILVLSSTKFHEVLRDVEALFLIRDLINMPTNAMGPTQLAQVTENLAKRFKARFKQWVGDDLLKANFPAIYAVGQASAEAPRLLSFTWGDPNHRKLALVGKGVCFDSGGLDLKPSSTMRFMKKDMGGAAHVLGLAQLIMSYQLPIYLHVLIPAVENAIGGNAYRPGDVITMRNGLTVEIDNTDAEGRLILADALTKACEDKPDLIIDFATLTGAARVAVGTDIAALFSNDSQLAESLLKSSQKTHDPIWRLPLFQNYLHLLDSSIADLSNSGSSPYAGAITAALFLERFIENTIPWAHFDIMAWNPKSSPGKPEGGEVMGVRACFAYLVGL